MSRDVVHSLLNPGGGTRNRLLFSSLLLLLPLLLVTTPTTLLLTNAQSVNLGKFVYNHHGLTGEVTLLNDRQYRIKGFGYDGKGPAVFHTGMRRGTVGVYSAAAYTFANEHNSCGRLDKPYSNVNVVITLPRNLSLSRDIETLAVYCYKFCHNFGHVKIPRGLKLPAAPGNLKGGVLCKPNYPTCSRDRTRDNAVCVDDRGVDGTCPVVKTTRQQATKSSSSTGRSGNRFQQQHNQQARNSRNRQTNSNGGSGGGGRPAPRVIGRFRSHANGVVGQVTILNDRQFRVRGFSYTGARSKSTHFILMEKGVTGVFSVKGFAVPDEKGACNGLRSYRNEDIVVTIPQDVSLSRDVSAIGVYDYENCSNFAHVKLPDRLNVPKASSSVRSIKRNVCLPFYRPCSRRDTTNPGICKGRRGTEVTC